MSEAGVKVGEDSVVDEVNRVHGVKMGLGMVCSTRVLPRDKGEGDDQEDMVW